MARKRSDTKTVFITGAGGGLGGATARYLAERDWTVFAADFDARALKALAAETDVIPVQLDVTDATSCEAARRRVARTCDGLDGIVNFADLAILKGKFFQQDANADLTGDNLVNFADLARMKALFFQPPGPSGLHPQAP